MIIEELIEKAREASKLAYAPFSTYHVGAVIYDAKGSVYCGANIEFATYTSTVHAERAALIQYLLNPNRGRIIYLVVYTNDDPPWFPCGICRQDIHEFAEPETIIIACNDKPGYRMSTLAKLLPEGFKR